jgi:hypothetical protein
MEALTSARAPAFVRRLLREVIELYADWGGVLPQPQIEVANRDRHVPLSEALDLCRCDAVLTRADVRSLQHLGIFLDGTTYADASKAVRAAIASCLLEV